MKTIQLIFVPIFALTCTSVIGQSQKQLEREKNKVEIFSVEERANLQLLFYDKTKVMNLTEKVEEEYYRYLLHYVYDMHRLNDRDKDYTKEEIKEELEKLIVKMNAKIEPILTEQQFEVHVNNWNDMMKVVYFKSDWEWTES
ncbi:hypothetical protein [Winogradskyella sp.]|uniref:hypothetical protein n=1 Tax=Winogradskyella sp. TaxID=1883156 RepID=UPI00261A8304|nr:hypothetical protein [Winogradskyella sp.]